MSTETGGFTLPGEAGFEDLTLRMAKKWGADVIRDSDGTELSPEILDAGYGIYSTICIIRDHNEWAKKNRDKLQQTFLMTQPSVAVSDEIQVSLLQGFFEEQFQINASEKAMKYWQVYDRTTDREIDSKNWAYDEKLEKVIVRETIPFHSYSVSFLAYRIWEEISMYNHVTNHWEKEHLLQLDPRYEEVQAYMLDWLESWCEQHPHTSVVRFTSLFYNFVWIWGSSDRNRSLFTDWGSYDFTVSPNALEQFQKEYGYRLSAEDFINQGKLQATHMPATKQKKDWMEFINKFVVRFGKQLIAIAHRYGKQAYVFYDDSWIGLEPYSERFGEFGFDGLIKCVFSGYEARLCAGVNVPVHELRLHPYLFPTGLGGAPTFTEGGNPTRDAKEYWIKVRRALLREPIERIGLGGYLHLTEKFPDFQDYIENLADEFRLIKRCHEQGKPYVKKPRVAVLHYWGKLRSWTLSGHFHETFMHDLIHVNEALSGLPLQVDFIDFSEVEDGALTRYDVIINAGRAGSAWSGGDVWKNERVIQKLTEWVYEGGAYIGMNEPSAAVGYADYFRMANVLGVDEDTGARVCHGRWQFIEEPLAGLFPKGADVEKKDGIYLTDPSTRVLCSQGETPKMTIHSFGKGCGVYMGGFSFSFANARLLLNLILHVSGDSDAAYLTDNANTECAWFKEAGKLVVINNTDEVQEGTVATEEGSVRFRLQAYGYCEIDV